MTLSLSVVSMLFGSTASSGGFDYAAIARGATSTSASGTANVGSVTAALVSAEKNVDKQLAQTAKDPQVQKDLERYEKVLKNADSIEDVLNDPIARKVLMTASGLRADVDNIGLAMKGLMSDPTDSNSVAAQMSSINGAWYDFAKNFDLAQYGLDRLYPQNDGVTGRWRVAFEREGESVEAMLEISKVRGGGYQATVDGEVVPIIVDGEDVEINLLWRDGADELRTSTLTGTLGKTGFSGSLRNDGETTTSDWSAAPYFKDALAEVKNNYIAEKRLDLLDEQMPGLGSAVLFKQVASQFESAVDILGSGLGREVITTAFNIPKQIAIQSMEAQEKAIDQRIDYSKLKNASYVDVIAQRYLIMLNGGIGGVTA